MSFIATLNPFGDEHGSLPPSLISLPELQWLGRIEKGGGAAPYSFSWCERNLWRRGLVDLWRDKHSKKTHPALVEITPAGRALLTAKRQEWRLRRSNVNPSAKGGTHA